MIIFLSRRLLGRNIFVVELVGFIVYYSRGIIRYGELCSVLVRVCLKGFIIGFMFMLGGFGGRFVEVEFYFRLGEIMKLG